MPSNAKRPRKSGPIRWVLAWFSGLLRFTVTTAVFFAVMVAICYGMAMEFIRGDEKIAPDLRNKKLVEVLKILKDENLSLKLDRVEPNENVPPGMIISQEPKPNVTIKGDTPIRVVLSEGAPLMPVPDLVGETKISAGIRLRKIGLNVGNVTTMPVSDGPGGIILSTDPPGGSGVVQDAKINLLVSAEREGETHAMPRLDGLSLAEAKELLGQMGLTMAESTPVAANDVQAGQIHAQTPNPGVPVDASTRITVAYAPEQDYPLWQLPQSGEQPAPDESVHHAMIPPIERLDGRPDVPAHPAEPAATPASGDPSIDLNLEPGQGKEAEPKFYF